MTLIQHIELGSAAANITFSSIAGTYTDLLVIISARTDRSDLAFDDLFISFNGSSANFSGRRLQGNGSSASSFTDSNNYFGILPTSLVTSSTFGSMQLYIPNYTASVAKSISNDLVTENNGTQAFQLLSANLWNNTAAITSIALTTGGTRNFVAGSSATLFGIKSGSDGTTTVS